MQRGPRISTLARHSGAGKKYFTSRNDENGRTGMKPCDVVQATVWNTGRGTLLALIAAGLALGGCACNNREAQVQAHSEHDEHGEHAPPAADAPRLAVVNAYCPIAGDHPVGENKRTAEDLTRMWRGQRVGFCCDQCPMWWDDMDDAEREKALGAAMKLEQDQPPKGSGSAG
jgi:hypothetical protein